MIRFSLTCEKEHGFEGWFASNDAFDAQVKEGFLECPFCGSKRVEKALMAPNVVTGKRRARPFDIAPDVAEGVSEDGDDDTAPAAAAAVEPVGMPEHLVPAPEAAGILAKLQDLSRKLRANTENVGKDFAEEARKIHFGETAPRAIYGQATSDEVQSLIEDGVAIAPLAPLPEDRN